MMYARTYVRICITVHVLLFVHVDQHFTIDDGSVPASNVTTIVDTTKNTTCTSDTDISSMSVIH